MNIQTLIGKYQGLIKAETDYLASPEGQSSPEDQRMFATQKAFFYQQFVDELEKVTPWISVKDSMPENCTDVLVNSKREWENDSPIMQGHYDQKYSCWFCYELHEDEYANVTHWQPLPPAPTI